MIKSLMKSIGRVFMKYVINVLASLSVMLNTVTGGSYRNTFSARVGYQSFVHHKGWAKKVEKFINWLPFFAKNHCFLEYQEERETFK